MDNPTDQDAGPLTIASLAFDLTAEDLVRELRENFPDTPPLGVAAMVFRRAMDLLTVAMPMQAVRAGLLQAFELSHETPMTFIERGHAIRALDALSKARRDAGL